MKKNKFINFTAVALLAFLMGCSTLSGLNRRPFMDNVGFIGVAKDPNKKASGFKEEKIEKCGRIWFTYWGGPPKFSDLINEMREENILYVKNATSEHWGSDGILSGSSCIAIKGQVYR